jgi:glycine cleavage system H protein
MSGQPDAQARDAAGSKSPSSTPGESNELTFMMGQFSATFPTDRLYARNHMWGQRWEGGAPAEPSRYGSAGASPSQSRIRFGFTAYAVRLLQDVYFLDWSHDAGAMVHEKQQIGSIESKKAESDLFCPLAGTITAYNKELLADPSAINVDKYGRGWLFEMEAEPQSLLTAEQYLEHLASVWEVTQRTIKGQLNE